MAQARAVNGIHLLDCGYDVIFVDASIESVNLIKKKLVQRSDAAERTEVLHVAPDAKGLPLEDNSLDYVVCMSVISLLEKKDAIEHLISEFHRVLKPGGKMIADINGPESDFATKGTFIDEDTFEYSLHGDDSSKLRCYCPRTKEKFAELFSYFEVDDIGNVSFQYCGEDSNEFIALVHKPE
jgi:ubiquinone/menaquinone biosynthesis C-methylase UbiE